MTSHFSKKGNGSSKIWKGNDKYLVKHEYPFTPKIHALDSSANAQYFKKLESDTYCNFHHLLCCVYWPIDLRSTMFFFLDRNWRGMSNKVACIAQIAFCIEITVHHPSKIEGVKLVDPDWENCQTNLRCLHFLQVI